MSKLFCLLLTLSLTTSLNHVIAQSVASGSSTKMSAAPEAFAGAWTSEDGKEFAMMNNGFFSSIAQDSSGVWKETHAGSYKIDNANTITLKVLYSSFPDRVGALHTIEYEMKGDVLTLKWFKKLIDVKAGDVTAQMPKDSQTKYMRAKP